MSVGIRVREVVPSRTRVAMRLPFRFGSATVRALTLVRLKIIIERDGRTVAGHAADCAVPRWFRKDPTQSIDADVDELLASVATAATQFLRVGRRAHAPFALWWEVYRELVDALPADDPRRLVHGFGCALLERAMLDAVCRGAGVGFRDALRDDLFAIEPGLVRPEFADFDVERALPAQPLSRVRVRHTVGMLDPLDSGDVECPVGDGLPHTLVDVVAAHGVGAFKLKIGQGVARDAARLVAIARVLRGRVVAPLVTLDGNEQYPDIATVAALCAAVDADPDGAWLLQHVVFVEQPLARAVTFDAARNAGLEGLGFPCVIDEADTGIDAFGRARELGYRGVSAKSCKGVFRALLNRCVVARCGGFQTAEDLTTLPVHALHQDLALIATLGLEHAERNGHHFVGGAEHVGPATRARLLDVHPDLYRSIDGGLGVRIDGGAVGVGSLLSIGFGGPVADEG